MIGTQGVWLGLGGVGALLMALWGGRRAGLAWYEVAARVGWCALGGLLGGRLWWWAATPSARGWGALVAPRAEGFASLGALAGALAVALVWAALDPHARATAERRAWRGRWAGVLAPAGVWGMGLARLGCLARGCDFGRPLASEALPGVRYAAGSPAAAWWQAQGWGEALTPALHPFAGYLGGASLALVVLAWARYPAAEQGWPRAALVAWGYLIVRAGLELLRQPLDAPAGQPISWSLQHVHLALAAAALGALTWYARGALWPVRGRELAQEPPRERP